MLYSFFVAEDIECYIHSVSPVKKRNATSYFNCVLQKEDELVKSVCYAPEMRTCLEAIAKQKSPVKIKKYLISNKFGRDDVVIGKYTKVVPAESVPFNYKDIDVKISIASLAQVAPEQLGQVKGYVAQLTGTKRVALSSGPVEKQEVIIADPSGYIKLLLWRNHCNSVLLNQTYDFNKVRVKVGHGERYLNIPRDESECVINGVEPFSREFPTIDVVSTTNDVVGEIIGVLNIKKYHACCVCTKKVVSNGQTSYCKNCKMTAKSSKCLTQWYLRILVEDSKNASNKIRLTAYNDPALKLMEICNVPEGAEEAEFEQLLLMQDALKFGYDSITYTIIDTDKYDI